MKIRIFQFSYVYRYKNNQSYQFFKENQWIFNWNVKKSYNSLKYDSKSNKKWKGASLISNADFLLLQIIQMIFKEFDEFGL